MIRFHQKAFLLGISLLIAALHLSFILSARADEVELNSGRVIPGEITYEDDDRVELKTENYGVLTFKKYTIKRVTHGALRSSAPAAAPAAPSGGFPGTNPFAVGAGVAGPGFASAPDAGAANPFGIGGGVAGPGAGVPGGVNPFALTGGAAPGGNPFAPADGAAAPGVPGGNPFAMMGQPQPPTGGGMFGAPPAAAAPGAGVLPPTEPAAGAAQPGAVGESESVAVPAFSPEEMKLTLEETLPAVPPGFDGVLFGIEESFDVQMQRETPNGAWERAGDLTPIRVGYGVKTVEGKAKLALRGRDSLRLPPRSHIILRALNQDSSQVTIEVVSGSVWTNVAPRARAADFQVITPDLTAGVRGTLFKTTVIATEGSRVAVLDSTVAVSSNRRGESVNVNQGMAVIVDLQGVIKPPTPVLPAEYDEWQAWDEWRLDFYKNVASFSAVGAPVLMGLANQVAADNAAWEQTMNEANRQTAINNFGNVLDYYRDAFMRFAQDTGHVPDEQSEGWRALTENLGPWPGWKGPYIEDTQLPPRDPWRRPIRYKVMFSATGNIHGRIYSDGMNRRDDGAAPASDDLISFAMFYQIPSIAGNPAYRQGAAPANP